MYIYIPSFALPREGPSEGIENAGKEEDIFRIFVGMLTLKWSVGIRAHECSQARAQNMPTQSTHILSLTHTE